MRNTKQLKEILDARRANSLMIAKCKSRWMRRKRQLIDMSLLSAVAKTHHKKSVRKDQILIWNIESYANYRYGDNSSMRHTRGWFETDRVVLNKDMSDVMHMLIAESFDRRSLA